MKELVPYFLHIIAHINNEVNKIANYFAGNNQEKYMHMHQSCYIHATSQKHSSIVTSQVIRDRMLS